MPAMKAISATSRPPSRRKRAGWRASASGGMRGGSARRRVGRRFHAEHAGGVVERERLQLPGDGRAAIVTEPGAQRGAETDREILAQVAPDAADGVKGFVGGAVEQPGER